MRRGREDWLITSIEFNNICGVSLFITNIMKHNLWVHVALKNQWDNYFCIRGNFSISRLLKENVYRIGVFNENYKDNGGHKMEATLQGLWLMFPLIMSFSSTVYVVNVQMSLLFIILFLIIPFTLKNNCPLDRMLSVEIILILHDQQDIRVYVG